jgi:hypothetical protein
MKILHIVLEHRPIADELAFYEQSELGRGATSYRSERRPRH